MSSKNTNRIDEILIGSEWHFDIGGCGSIHRLRNGAASSSRDALYPSSNTRSFKVLSQNLFLPSSSTYKSSLPRHGHKRIRKISRLCSTIYVCSARSSWSEGALYVWSSSPSHRFSVTTAKSAGGRKKNWRADPNLLPRCAPKAPAPP